MPLCDRARRICGFRMLCIALIRDPAPTSLRFALAHGESSKGTAYTFAFVLPAGSERATRLVTQNLQFDSSLRVVELRAGDVFASPATSTRSLDELLTGRAIAEMTGDLTLMRAGKILQALGHDKCVRRSALRIDLLFRFPTTPATLRHFNVTG
ncbi:hypothetical protein AB1N83_010415 [Pleurotus pulmonarius]